MTLLNEKRTTSFLKTCCASVVNELHYCIAYLLLFDTFDVLKLLEIGKKCRSEPWVVLCQFPDSDNETCLQVIDYNRREETNCLSQSNQPAQ